MTTETEKNRIRGLHKEFSVIKEITVNESQLLLEKPPCNPTAGGYDGSVGQATEACRELGTACINYAASPGFFGCMVNPTMTYGGWSCGSCGGSVTNDGPTKLWADKYETPRDAGTTNGGSGDKGSDFVKKSISEKGVSRISERNLKILIRRAINEKTTKREMSEVYSEKQRRWACAQANLPNNKRQKSLSKKEAEEMCKDVNISKKK